MTNRGKKIQCTACGLKYYDLGQKDKPCPKCKNIPISSFKSKFKKKNNDKENSVKLELDFCYINDEKINQFLRDRNNALQAEIDNLRSGNESIEERARSDLGFVKDEEIYYFVVE